MLCAWFNVDDFMLACSDSPFGKHVFESIKEQSVRVKKVGVTSVSNSVARKSLKPTINTLEHGADLRSISQNT